MNPSATPAAPDFGPILGGEGELATLMREHDWSATPLGPLEGWPQSLRAAVRIVLSSRFAMWMGWGPELTFLYNDAYASMTLGAKHPWALGQKASVVWAEIWPQVGPRIARVLTRGEATWDERLLLFLERSGFPEETYHTFSYSLLADDAGQPAGMLCVVSEETERVIAERRLSILHELAAELAGADTSADVLRALDGCLAKDSRDLPFTLVYLLDSEGTPKLAVATGLPAGHPAAAADVAPPWPLSQVVSSGGTHVVELPKAMVWPAGPFEKAPERAVIVPISQAGQSRPNGVLVAGLNRYRPFDDAYRTFVGLFVGQLSAGLSAARQFETERQRAESLAELDRAKTAFFSNVSHEFRTPLTLMLGPTEDALTAGRAVGGAELETVHRNMLRLLKLVNTLLDFSRMESGRSKAAFRSVDLATLTVDLASTFRSAVERAGLEFRVEVARPSAPVFVDPQMWEAIVLNLISNAFKFTLEGRIEVKLSEPRPREVELCVSDSGVGIPPGELARVFERFHRIEGTRARTHEGSGIGLTLVQDLVRLHGGRIGVESVLGSGSSFRVTLPTGSAHLPSEHVLAVGASGSSSPMGAAYVAEALRWLPSEDEPPLPQPELVSIVPEPAVRSRILIADDNADMRDYLTRLLGAHFDVEAVGDGEAALQRVRQAAPDMILTDVMMPRVDGFALLAQLRADHELSSIPVIMLSARAGEEARIEGIHAGADDYLVKPFSSRELLARVLTRLELVRLRKRLFSERQWLANLIARNPMPIVAFRGDDLRFDAVNEPYLAAIGKADVVGKPLLEVLPELREQGFAEVLRTVMSSGVPHVGHETRVRLEENGRSRDTYWTFIYAPLAGDGGRIEGVIAFCNHVTEQVEARRRVEALALEAASANRAKDEFLAMLGHELRNPLAPMLTALQLMRLRGHASREQDVLERQVNHLSRLVNDLLDVSRITRGSIELTRTHVELSEVVARAVEIASPLLEHSHHTLELQVPTHGFSLFADVDRMAQVVSNLLTNAAKYSDAHSRISVRAERAGSLIRLRVRDHGIGIERKMLQGIFDAFVQQPQSIERARGGLGLGLAIVRSLVEKHGGSVRAESDGVGLGSEFIVELPAADERQATTAPKGSGASPAFEAQRGKQVLVVDDNEDAGAMLKQALEELGYRVELAHDGPSALRIAVEFRPDIALLDIGLPVMDGYELAQRLRAESLTPPRLLAITGYGQPGDRERSRQAGFEAHLVKPLDLDLLERAIESPPPKAPA